jgi:hypothetical protein
MQGVNEDGSNDEAYGAAYVKAELEKGTEAPSLP